MPSLDQLPANPGPDEPVATGRAVPAAPVAGLDGLRVAVKDLVAVAGRPLGAGSRARAGAPAERRDAAVVARLRAAGAEIGPSVALHELAFGTTGINDQVGFPPNPHDPARIPGGSSSGSAVAVAEGSADLGIGTDTGGSVRIPAAFCGVVGFKPAFGSYPTDGVLALSSTLDHVGLLAADVATVARTHHALTGDPEASLALARPGRLAVERTALAVADAPVAAAVERVLRVLADAGWELVDVGWPGRERVQEVSTTVMFGEAAAHHRRLLEGRADRLGPDVLVRLRAGAAIADDAYRAALDEAVTLRGEVSALLAGFDAIVAPTVPVVAPTIESTRADATTPAVLVSNTRIANVTGHPAVSVPVPTDGLPVGLQVLAGTDARALAVAAAVEAVARSVA